MLEKLAELVRERTSWTIPCCICTSHNCEISYKSYKGCPTTGEPDGSLMLARWAVLLVAKALEHLAEVDRTNGVDLGDVEALGWDFMDLYYEAKKAEATADGCKSGKQAGEVAE